MINCVILIPKYLAYSHGFAPCNFFLFPTTKNHLKGSHFKTMEDIQNVMMVALNSSHIMTSVSVSTVGNNTVVCV